MGQEKVRKRANSGKENNKESGESANIFIPYVFIICSYHFVELSLPFRSSLVLEPPGEADL